MCHLNWQISSMCKKIELKNSMWDLHRQILCTLWKNYSMWDLHWQILTICANSEKNNSMWDLDWQMWTDCKKNEQNNSMCHLDWQIGLINQSTDYINYKMISLCATWIHKIIVYEGNIKFMLETTMNVHIHWWHLYMFYTLW